MLRPPIDRINPKHRRAQHVAPLRTPKHICCPPKPYLAIYRTMSIKVLSYNIHKGFNAAGTEFVLPQIRDALNCVEADVVLLQEVQGKPRQRRIRKISPSDSPQHEYLADGNWPHHIYAKNAVYQKAHHGNAILSKHPFIKWENIDVSFAKRASRSLLHGFIQFPGHPTTVHVICIHLGLFKAERKIQLTALSERIKEHVPNEEPLIIAGDFNDWRGQAEHHLESDLQLKEVFKVLYGDHAKTFPALRPTVRVDRIYYRGLNLKYGQILSGMPWKRLSDHIPLFAELTF